MDDVRLDDDRTLLQKIFKSLPRKSRLEHFSSILLCSKGTDYKAALYSAECVYEEVIALRQTIIKALARDLLGKVVLGYLRFISDPASRIFPETYEQHALGERYLKVAEDSADALMDYYGLSQPEEACLIIECLPRKRQKAVDCAGECLGEEAVRLVLYKFRLCNIELDHVGNVLRRFPRRVSFNPDPDVSQMAAEWLLENAQTQKSLDIVKRYKKDLEKKADQKIDKGFFVIRMAKRFAKKIVKKFRPRPGTKRIIAN